MESRTSQPPRGTSLAPTRVPEAYVRAEMATWPLTSPVSLECTLVELDPSFEAGTPTLRLWRECEEHLVQHASGWSLDRLIAVRDATWFGWAGASDGKDPVPLHRYLRHLVDERFVYAPGTLMLRQPPGASMMDVINHHYWLTFSVPEDLLLAAVPLQPPPRRVLLPPTLFERHLGDFGVAEIHQHASAGLDFPLAWAGALAALADPDLVENQMASPGARFSDGADMARWLLMAAIARVVLGEFLMVPGALRGRSVGDRSFHSFVRFLADAGGRRLRWGPTHMNRVLTRALRALVQAPGATVPPFEELHYLYGRLFPAGARLADAPPQTVEDVRRCDPIGSRLGLADHADGERWLVRHGLAYLEQRDRGGLPDRDFAAVFWQVQRMRCAFYRYVVQRPLTAGLQWFVRFAKRTHPLARPLKKVLVEANFRVAGGGRARRVVGGLEVRKTLPDDPVTFAEDMLDVVESWQHVLSGEDTEHLGNEAELGVVLHFVKERDAGEHWKEGAPRPFGKDTFAQPIGPPRRPTDASFYARLARFNKFVERLARKASSVAEVLRAEPILLWLVRGVDVASDELAVPTWVLVPFYRYLRDESAIASMLGGERAAPPLRATAHVGEDFRHLMEGLRRIYEATTYLLGESRGRLGHATALGVSPRAWAESTSPLLMPLEDRLWDLVFEWRLYADPRVAPEFVADAPAGRLERLNNLIADGASELFGRSSHGGGFTPRDLADVHEHLHGFMTQELPGGPGSGDLERVLERAQRLTAPGGAESRLWEHLQNPEMFRRGQKLVDVSVDASEIEALEAVQIALRRGIAARGIVVEVNPTSNLLIGNLLDLRHHPLLRLCPVEPEDGVPPVPVAIGSDDPIVFSTSLLHEYEMMQMTARAAGYPEMTVSKWMERIRQTAFDARFTLPWRPRARDLARTIACALERYLHVPGRRALTCP
jgi:hypothetical protein